MKEKQKENEESRIWKNGAEIKQRDTEAKDNASEVNDRDIAIQEKQMARQDTIKKETAQEVSSVESKEVVPDRKKAEGKDYLFPPAKFYKRRTGTLLWPAAVFTGNSAETV